MAMRTVVCPDCSEPLTLGRLSCSNCGSLLASVTGAPRRTRPLRTVMIEEPAWLSDDDSPGWVLDEGIPPDADEDHEPRSWQAEVAAPPGEAAPRAIASIVVEPGQVDTGSPDDGPGAVLAGPEAPAAPAWTDGPRLSETEPDHEPGREAVAEPVGVRTGAGPRIEPEPRATEPPAAATEPVPDPEGSPDAEPVSAADRVDPRTQLSWVDLRVAAISGPGATAASDASRGQRLAEPETGAAAEASIDAASEPRPDAASEPRPEESPVEPDVPAADPITVVPDETPGTITDPTDVPEVVEEPVGAPGDVDDAAEPPPPDVLSAVSTGQRPRTTDDDEPARPLEPSHSSWSQVDLTARPATRAAGPEARAATGAPIDGGDEDDPPVAWTPADGWMAPGTEASSPDPPAGAWVPPAPDLAAAPATAPHAAAKASVRRADLRLDAPDDLPTGLTVVGSGIATLGFLLPWAAAVPASPGWTDRWGLADTSYLLVFLASALLLGVNIVPNRLMGWIRAGVLPLGLGGLLLGLVWPAMLGASGMQLGAVAVTFAASLLVAGGVVGVSRARHEGPQATA